MVNKETAKLSSFDNLCIYLYCECPLEWLLMGWLLPHPAYQFAFSEIIRIGSMNG